MKHIQTFESYINESVNINESESADYEYKKDSGGGRPTMVLSLQDTAWEKVKHLFDDAGRPISDEIKNYAEAGSKWQLYTASYVKGGTAIHKIYGASGDWTFGNAPMFYQQAHRGNIKAAKAIFDQFIKTYLS